MEEGEWLRMERRSEPRTHTDTATQCLTNVIWLLQKKLYVFALRHARRVIIFFF